MKRLPFLSLAVLAASFSMLSLTGCNDDETYADQKEKEKSAIKKFLNDNELIGKINVIDEAQFYAQDSITDTTRNEFVLFNDNGIYLQIVSKGEGKSMVELAKEMPDSTVSKVLLCRFMEYDISNADTTRLNLFTPTIVDKMLCTYSLFSRSYKASFTEGFMQQGTSTQVPEGWLQPLDFVRLTRDPGKIAKVRVIVPHSSGTSNASTYVLPYYYEISYQLGR